MRKFGPEDEAHPYLPFTMTDEYFTEIEQIGIEEGELEI